MEWAGGISVFLVGILVGFINTLAGGGSLISLPLLIFLGLPANVANGTNRLAILVQSLVATVGFHRKRKLPWRLALSLTLPATVGAWFGAGLAAHIDEALFKRILAVFLVLAIAFFLKRTPPQPRTHPAWLLLPVFLAIGFYGGFLQAGVGILILLATVGMCGMDLTKANAIKSVMVSCYTVFALVRFVQAGQVVWSYAIVLAVGNLAGALFGVSFAVTRSQRTIQYVVAGMLALMAVGLWFQS